MIKKEVKQFGDSFGGKGCVDCIFNYDSISCRVYPDEYKKRDDSFDIFEETPGWCNIEKIVLHIKDEK